MKSPKQKKQSLKKKTNLRLLKNRYHKGKMAHYISLISQPLDQI